MDLEIFLNQLAPYIANILGAAGVPKVLPRKSSSTIEKFTRAVNTNPALAAGIELRILLGLSMMGDFSHDFDQVQEYGRDNLKNLKGSFLDVVAKSLTSFIYGQSITEVNLNQDWTLASLISLDQNRYKFRADPRDGSLVDVEYNSGAGYIYLPIEKVIHLVNQPYFCRTNDPYGTSLVKRAMPYVDAMALVLESMTIATLRSATPFIVGYANSEQGIQLVNADGSPMVNGDGEPIIKPATQDLSEKLVGIKNASVFVTDINNKIEAIAQQSDGQIFIEAVNLLQNMIFLCMLAAPTILGTSTGGSGDSNLNKGHRDILLLATKSTMEVLAETYIESLMKPLLLARFGELDNYGAFPISADGEDTIELIEAINGFQSAIKDNPATDEVLDRVYSLAGIT